ncbi:MAG TPA: class I SAM-dependent methyltransferase [Nitrospira sp.]|nr:class I SAM-dependent methyltransferase [Nitrospira sp.]
MINEDRIRIFDSQSEAYKQAFQIFLDHTDQKRNAKRWLQQVVDRLPARKVLIDAGAGNGEVARTLAHAFERTIAIEPNAYLLTQLREAVPDAEVIGQPIMAARPPALGDLVLCSHTFYYIPPEDWMAHLERLVSWMSPTGVTIVVLQHRESGCMDMVHHFFGHRFELRRTADLFRMKHGDRYEVVTTRDPAEVVTADLTQTYAVAEFMLNLLAIQDAPTRRDVEAYIESHFSSTTQGYRIPVDQDFLQIRPRAAATLA